MDLQKLSKKQPFLFSISITIQYVHGRSIDGICTKSESLQRMPTRRRSENNVQR